MTFLFSSIQFYLSLCLVSVTLHVSVHTPHLSDPKAYSLVTCSGVFISPDEILTAGHCVEHSRGRQWVKTSDGRSYSAEIETVDKIKDLALLRVLHLAPHRYVQFGKPINITEPVFTVNSSEGWEKTYNQGMVNNLIDDVETGVQTILHSASIIQGASGSGLFNGRGELVGINTATLKPFSSAVDVTVINQFLHRR